MPHQAAAGLFAVLLWLPAASLALMQPAADQRYCAAMRSGLTPLHPAIRAPDVRQALAAHHRLHSSIFDSASSSWTTEEALGRASHSL